MYTIPWKGKQEIGNMTSELCEHLPSVYSFRDAKMIVVLIEILKK